MQFANNGREPKSRAVSPLDSHYRSTHPVKSAPAQASRNIIVLIGDSEGVQLPSSIQRPFLDWVSLHVSKPVQTSLSTFRSNWLRWR